MDTYQLELGSHCLVVGVEAASLAFGSAICLFAGLVMYAKQRKLWWLISLGGAALFVATIFVLSGSLDLAEGACPAR